jgi:hypothetical protein
MHRSRAVTVWQALGTTAAALVTSAALALPASAGTAAGTAAGTGAPAAAGTGGPAPGSARPAATGNFTTWPQAETAASFPLRRPTRLHGLHRAGPVSVRRCETRGQHHKRVVSAIYGTPFSPLLSIAENNSGAPCAPVSEPFLRNVRIHGGTGRLYGACLGSCRHGVLDLTWQRNGTFYDARSANEPQHVLLNFARHLHQVA